MAPASPAIQTYDVFNGDADGICALHQLRLAFPKDAALVTGVKRDVALLQRVPQGAPLDITVLDVSFDANAVEVKRLLDAGSEVHYFDHHSARHAFRHPRLHLHWDNAADVCTSILVDRYLQGRFRQWAVVAAFGDGLPHSARALARQLGLDERLTDALEELGLLLNYNAYGERIADLLVAPDSLYRILHQFVEPRDFIANAAEYRLLAEAYRDDASRMKNLKPHWKSTFGVVYVLPCESWARRVSGIFANELVRDGRSCAVLNEKADGSYLVSVRSVDPARRPANVLCEKFASGGGRSKAAGVNYLPPDRLGEFVGSFFAYFDGVEPGAAGDVADES